MVYPSGGMGEDTGRDTGSPYRDTQRVTIAEDERIGELKDQIDYLRDQLAQEREARRRADTIIAQLTQANATLAARIPELEAPRDESESPERGGEPSDSG